MRKYHFRYQVSDAELTTHSIIEKLEELGWGSEIRAITYPDNFGSHRLVNQPHKLTERST